MENMISKNILLLSLLTIANFGFSQNAPKEIHNIQNVSIKTKHGNLAFSKRCRENDSFYRNENSKLTILKTELFDEAESKHIKNDEVIIVFNVDPKGILKKFRIGRKAKLKNLNLLAEKFCQELEAECQKNNYKVVLNCSNETDKVIIPLKYFQE